MLLPEIRIFISVDMFDTKFKYFFQNYVKSIILPNLTLTKSEIELTGHRYTIFIESEESPIRVGEIDVIPVHEEKITILAAAYNIERFPKVIIIFNEFYNLIFENWQIDPRDRGYLFDNELATSEWISIGVSTGYFFLPEVRQEMNELFIDNFNHSLNDDLEIFKDDFYGDINSDRNEINVNYHRKIGDGLIREYQYELVKKERKDGVSKLTELRANRIKEIKDNNFHWTQDNVVVEYNNRFEGDDKITCDTLRYAYRKMGWNWPKVGRIQ